MKLINLFENTRILQGEAEVVWLYAPCAFPFVRAVIQRLRGRMRRPAWPYRDGRTLIGYTVLDKDTQLCWGGAYRRFFYITEYDFNPDELHWQPSESVDPQTISPGVQGRWSECCKQVPTPSQRVVIEAALNEQRAKSAMNRQLKHYEPLKAKRQQRP